MPDLNVGLMLIFIGFFRCLLASPSSEVVVVALLAARDVRSSLGKNLALVREASGGLDPWVASTGQLKAALQRSERREVPEADFWRVGLLQKLLAERLLANYAADAENEKRLESLISSLVQNCLMFPFHI